MVASTTSTEEHKSAKKSSPSTVKSSARNSAKSSKGVSSKSRFANSKAKGRADMAKEQDVLKPQTLEKTNDKAGESVKPNNKAKVESNMNTKAIWDIEFNDTKLRKVNFANHLVKVKDHENFPNMPLALYKHQGLGSIFKSFEDDSVCSAKFIYSLERIGSDKGQKKNFKSIMEQLYRICCDGALVEIRALTPYYVEHSGDPTIMRTVTEEKLRYFDRDYANNVLAKDERNALAISDLHDINVPFALTEELAKELYQNDDTQAERPIEYLKKLPNFKILKSMLKMDQALQESILNSKFPSEKALLEYIKANIEHVQYQTFYLCVKKPDLTKIAPQKTSGTTSLVSALADTKLYKEYAFCRMDNIDPFILRVRDVENKSMFLSRSLLNSGVWEYQESRLVVSFINLIASIKGSVNVANIGANIGWYTIIAGLCNSKAKVDCFEPTPDTLEYLAHNVHLNKLGDRVTIYPFALSNKKEELKFYIDEDNDGSNSLAEWDRNDSLIPGHKVITVPCETMDNVYLNKDKSLWPDFCVVDVEGHESLLFEGAQGMFNAGFRPLILTEFAPSLMALRGDKRFFDDLMKKYGYKAYVVLTNQAINELIANNQDVSNLNVSEVSYEYVDELYKNLSHDNPNCYYNDILFVPPSYKCNNGSISVTKETFNLKG